MCGDVSKTSQRPLSKVDTALEASAYLDALAVTGCRMAGPAEPHRNDTVSARALPVAARCSLMTLCQHHSYTAYA